MRADRCHSRRDARQNGEKPDLAHRLGRFGEDGPDLAQERSGREAQELGSAAKKPVPVVVDLTLARAAQSVGWRFQSACEVQAHKTVRLAATDLSLCATSTPHEMIAQIGCQCTPAGGSVVPANSMGSGA